jgi:hypothetical protein
VFVQNAATGPVNCRYDLYRKQNEGEEITSSAPFVPHKTHGLTGGLDVIVSWFLYHGGSGYDTCLFVTQGGRQVVWCRRVPF